MKDGPLNEQKGSVIQGGGKSDVNMKAKSIDRQHITKTSNEMEPSVTSLSDDRHSKSTVEDLGVQVDTICTTKGNEPPQPGKKSTSTDPTLVASSEGQAFDYSCSQSCSAFNQTGLPDSPSSVVKSVGDVDKLETEDSSKSVAAIMGQEEFPSDGESRLVIEFDGPDALLEISKGQSSAGGKKSSFDFRSIHELPEFAQDYSVDPSWDTHKVYFNEYESRKRVSFVEQVASALQTEAWPDEGSNDALNDVLFSEEKKEREKNETNSGGFATASLRDVLDPLGWPRAQEGFETTTSRLLSMNDDASCLVDEDEEMNLLGKNSRNEDFIASSGSTEEPSKAHRLRAYSVQDADEASLENRTDDESHQNSESEADESVVMDYVNADGDESETDTTEFIDPGQSSILDAPALEFIKFEQADFSAPEVTQRTSQCSMANEAVHHNCQGAGQGFDSYFPPPQELSIPAPVESNRKNRPRSSKGSIPLIPPPSIEKLSKVGVLRGWSNSLGATPGMTTTEAKNTDVDSNVAPTSPPDSGAILSAPPALVASLQNEASVRDSTYVDEQLMTIPDATDAGSEGPEHIIEASAPESPAGNLDSVGLDAISYPTNEMSANNRETNVLLSLSRKAQDLTHVWKVPDGNPSPFEWATNEAPDVIERILCFLGDPVFVCRIKMMNRNCRNYIDGNEQRLMRDAVRLGGLNKNVRPSFWLWLTLERCDMNDCLLPSYCVAELDKSTDLRSFESMGTSEGRWHGVIERDVSRAFGNLPPHKSGARLRTDSIVRALVTWGKSRIVKVGVKGARDPPNLSASSSAEHEEELVPTDTVSDWSGVTPVGSFAASACDIDDERPNRVFTTIAASELALGNVLTEERKNSLQRKLSFILHALAKVHSDVGYCQGEDYVVAHLLRILQDTIRWKAYQGALPECIVSAERCRPSHQISSEELKLFYAMIDRSFVVEETCFRVMNTLFTTYGLRHFYWPELRCLKTSCLVFERLIQAKLPVLADHFEHHELNVGLFALGWFQTMFLYLPSMPSATVCHMWDIWLVERSFKIFFRVGCAILFLSQPILLNSELEGMMCYLNTFPDATVLRPEILIPCALQIKVTNRMLMEIEEELSRSSSRGR